MTEEILVQYLSKTAIELCWLRTQQTDYQLADKDILKKKNYMRCKVDRIFRNRNNTPRTAKELNGKCCFVSQRKCPCST